MSSGRCTPVARTAAALAEHRTPGLPVDSSTRVQQPIVLVCSRSPYPQYINSLLVLLRLILLLLLVVLLLLSFSPVCSFTS